MALPIDPFKVTPVTPGAPVPTVVTSVREILQEKMKASYTPLLVTAAVVAVGYYLINRKK